MRVSKGIEGTDYFMRSNFMRSNFRHVQAWTPERGGAEVMGPPASLLAKATPSLLHHSSIREGSLDMTIFLKIFSSCLSCPSWIKDMLCYPRETSPRSFHSPRSIPQVARCREVALRAALPSPRRPGVIHGVTPPGSVLTLSPEADRYPSDTHWWYRRF